MAQKRVFVSYSREDAAPVGELERDIESLGHDAWVDRELSGGQRWWEQILTQIRECDIFVVAISDACVSSRACQAEYQYANALGKPVLPVLVERNVSDSLMPPDLAELQRVDYTAPDKSAFASLNRALVAVPAAPALPDPLPDPPPVPASYLFDLRSEIDSRQPLTAERQGELLRQLDARFEDGHSPADLRVLVARFRERDDVLVRVDRELADFDARLVAAESSASRGRATAAGASVEAASDAAWRTPPTAQPAPGAAAPALGAPPVPLRAASEREVNMLWWAAPVFAGLIGGAVAWLAVRGTNAATARNMLIGGVVSSFVWAMLLSGA